MLKICPIANEAERGAILARCRIRPKEGFFSYQATDNDALLGAAQFDIGGKTAVLDAIRQAEGTKEDWEGMFILGRAVLNFLDLCTVERVVCHPETESEAHLIRTLGFREDNGVYEIALAGLFDGKCRSGGDETPPNPANGKETPS